MKGIEVLEKMNEEVEFGFKKCNKTKGVEVLENMNEEVEFGFQNVEQDERCWGFKKDEGGCEVWVSKS